jgi:hypothetical protein
MELTTEQKKYAILRAVELHVAACNHKCTKLQSRHFPAHDNCEQDLHPAHDNCDCAHDNCDCACNHNFCSQ